MLKKLRKIGGKIGPILFTYELAVKIYKVYEMRISLIDVELQRWKTIFFS